eukprot:jgi/Botrbrau1/22980/Bobra.0030s0047.1
MLDCCTKGLALQAEAEGKRHPRDFFSDGRIRVRLKDESGKPVVPSIPNRKELFIKIAELVPRHPGRTGKKAVSSAAPAGLPNLPGLKPTGGQAGTSKESAKSGSNKKKKGRK